MNALCPDCNIELTPSIMGYLCHGCGNVHQFAKVSDAKPTSGKGKSKANQAKASKAESSQKSSRLTKPLKVAKQPAQKASTSKSLRHKVKNFLVPEIAELPKPVDESHLVTEHNTDGKPAKHAQGSKASVLATPPLAAAIAQNEAAHNRSNESFAEYMQQEDRESGQNVAVTVPHPSRVPIVLSIVVVLATILLIFVLVYNI